MFAVLIGFRGVSAESGNSGSGSDSSSDSSDHDSDDDSDDEDDSSSSTSGALEIEVDVFTDTTIVKVEMNDRKNSFKTTSTTREAIIADILAKYPSLTQVEVEAVLNLEIENRASRPQDVAGSDRPVPNLFGKPIKTDDNSGFEKRENKMSEKRKLPAMEVLNRFSGAVKHIEKFIVRIEVAIEKFKADGKDTTMAEGYFNSAKTDLIEAKAHLTEAQSAWEANADGAKDSIREHLNLMKMEIRSAYENLKLTIKELKMLRDKSDDDSDDDSDEDNSGSN